MTITFPGAGHTPAGLGEYSALACGQLAPFRYNFCPPGTHHCWVSRDSMEWRVRPTPLHMTCSGNLRPFDLDPLSTRLRAPYIAQTATIHQVTTMLATSKNVLFLGHNHLLTTGIDDPSPLTGIWTIIKVSGHQYRWLAGGYDLEITHF